MNTILQSQKPIVMALSCLESLANTLGRLPVESGAILLAKDNVIQRAVHDSQAEVTRTTYKPNTIFLNPEMQRQAKEGFYPVAIAHTHESEITPSEADVIYYEKFCESLGLDQVFVPIILSMDDGEFKIFPYVYDYNSKSILKADLIVLSESFQERNKHHFNSSKNIVNFLVDKLSVVSVKPTDWMDKIATTTRQFSLVLANLAVGTIIVLLLWVLINVTPAIIIRFTQFLLS